VGDAELLNIGASHISARQRIPGGFLSTMVRHCQEEVKETHGRSTLNIRNLGRARHRWMLRRSIAGPPETAILHHHHLCHEQDQTRGGSYIIETLKPGEEWHEEITLGKFYDLARPDKYAVQLLFRHSPSGTTVQSNKIPITVMP
jgi:hypothetical protein